MDTIEVYKQRAAALVASYPLASLQMKAKVLALEDDASYADCVELRNNCATAVKRIDEYWKPFCEDANRLHKGLTTARAEMAKPWALLKDIFHRKAEQYLLDAKQAKRAAEEALAKAAAKDRKQLEGAAADLMAQGYVSEAKQKLAQAQVTVAPALPSAIPKVNGARVTDTWEWDNVDLMALIQAVAAKKIPLMHIVKGEEQPLLIVNKQVMDAVVSRLGPTMDWPGVEVTEGVSLKARKL